MKLSVKYIVVFGMLAAIMISTTWIMSFLPNMHLIDVFIVSITVHYRQKALYPIYLFAFLTGIFNGFALWWLPYLYIWLFPWILTMLLPRKMPKWLSPILYCLVAGLHGYLFGVLYAPAQALLFGLDFDGMISWIIAGIPFDLTHGTSNLIVGLLICPLIKGFEMSDKHLKN